MLDAEPVNPETVYKLGRELVPGDTFIYNSWPVAVIKMPDKAREALEECDLYSKDGPPLAFLMSLKDATFGYLPQESADIEYEMCWVKVRFTSAVDDWEQLARDS